MTTIRDVAKRAGVAPITVSRVINNSAPVNHKTRKRVEAAIAELNYIPNDLARSLRLKQTTTIALVLTDFTNPFWTTVARGVEDAASTHGFNVILCNTGESESKQETQLNLLVQKQVDGVLVVPAGSRSEQIMMIQQRLPVVVLDRRMEHVDVVRCDSMGGAYELVNLLLSLGHRRISLLNGPATVSTAIDRAAGYCQALRDAGLESDERAIHYGDYTHQWGYEMTQRMLETAPRPTALFAANNFIAIGALRALRDARVRVPEDMALVGFDDLPTDLIVDPFLTVATQPAYDMGKCAMELLLQRVAGQEADQPREIILPTQMIIRRSSGNPITHCKETL